MTGSSKLLAALTGKKKKKGKVPDPGFPEITGQHYLTTLVDIVTGLDADWYLEIGSRSGTSLAKIPCNFVAIDPEFQIANPVFQSARQMHFFQMTSDDFFADGFLGRAGITPDVAFIDGMHHFEYALRDFLNCEAAMGRDGVIILHDVCPSTAVMASRDMAELHALRPWTGDVWKVVLALLDHRPDLSVHILDAAKTGLCVVHGLDPANTILRDNLDAILAQYMDHDLGRMGPDTLYGRLPLEPAAGILDRIGAARKG